MSSIFPTLLDKKDGRRKKMSGEFLREVAALVTVFPALDFIIGSSKSNTDRWIEFLAILALSITFGILLLKKGISLGLEGYFLTEED